MTRKPAEAAPYRVLVVDDDPVHRLVTEESLAPPKYHVDAVADGASALALLAREDFDVVVTDRRMPGMSGEQLCRAIREQLHLPMLPIVMVTGSTSAEDLNRSLAAGADDFLRKPYHPVELRARVDAAAQRKRYTDHLDSTESTLFALARMIEAKDANTGDHCGRLAKACERLGEAMTLSPAELVALRRGGVLHDIGKLGIPDHVLLKPGPLDEAEWQVMRQHPVIGYELVAGLRSMRLTAPIIRHHHERWDGSGYPDGLAGEQIPLLARVFQIVDIYDALCFARPYKPALAPAQACAILEEEAARDWRDPALVRIFVDLVRHEAGTLLAPVDDAGDLGRALYERVAARVPQPA